MNEELVLLYFNVGRIVSEKVSSGFWGEGTVDELANFIVTKMPGIGGFNRRGLYRMKQFFDIYSDPDFVSPVAAQLEKYLSSIDKKSIVSALPTQLNVLSLQHRAFVSSILTKVSWTNHLEIISQTKSG